MAWPTFAEVRLRNKSGSREAFIIQADDGPLQKMLDFYESSESRTNKSGRMHDKERDVL